MPDTQQEIANSFAAVNATKGDRWDGAAARPAASAAGKISSRSMVRRAKAVAERSGAEASRSDAMPGETRITHTASRTSDDALALKRVYFSARVIPIVMSWPLCPVILSVPSAAIPFLPFLPFSSFASSPRISICRGTCHRIDKILVHIEVGTCEDTMFAIEERRDGSPFSFFIYLCHASHTVRRPSAHTYVILAPFPCMRVSKDIPKSCTMTNGHFRVSHLYYAVYLTIKSRSEYFSNDCSLYRARARATGYRSYARLARAFQFYVPVGNLVLEIALVIYKEAAFYRYAICSFAACYAATLFLHGG